MVSFDLVTDDGLTLRGDLATPAGAVVGAAVVCHPHPQYGGTMQAWLVPLLQRTLVDAGWTTVRFNFRGVGGSEGAFDHGRGEQRDVAAAVDAVLAEAGDVPLLVGGWSFGAAVSLRHALADRRVSAWFGVALPLATRPDQVPQTTADDVASDDRPLLFVHGTRDTLAPLAPVRDLADAAPGGRLVEVEGADHYFSSGAGDLAGAVRDLAAELAR